MPTGLPFATTNRLVMARSFIRMTVVEDIVRGSAQDEETAALAGGSASRGATPLNFNHFKIPLLENLVTRAIRDA